MPDGDFAAGLAVLRRAGRKRESTTGEGAPEGAPANDASKTLGLEAGAGIEFKVAQRVRIVGEYLFTSLDDREESTIQSQGPAPATNAFILVNPSGTQLRRSDRFDIHSLRAGHI